MKTKKQLVLLISLLSVSVLILTLSIFNDPVLIKAETENYKMVLDNNKNKIQETYSCEDLYFASTNLGSNIEFFVDKRETTNGNQMLFEGSSDCWGIMHDAANIWNNNPINGLKKITIISEEAINFTFGIQWGYDMGCTDGNMTYDGISPDVEENTGHSVFTFDISNVTPSPMYFNFFLVGARTLENRKDLLVTVYSVSFEYSC